METERTERFPIVGQTHVRDPRSRERLPMRQMFPPHLHHWRFVGIFWHDDLRAYCNMKCLCVMLETRAPEGSFERLVLTDTDDADIGTMVIIRDEKRAIEVAVDAMDVHDQHEHISDEAYWLEVDVHLQRMWKDLSAPDRIDYVRQSGAPPEAVLAERVSEDDYIELWTLLYQEMGL